jgi:hypothetical protein
VLEGPFVPRMGELADEDGLEEPLYTIAVGAEMLNGNRGKRFVRG